MADIINHGVQVVSARQWVTGLSLNAAGTGWNFISATWPGGTGPIAWHVIKNLTTSPTQVDYNTTTHNYPNQLFSVDTTHTNQKQLRAQNGRIFFPLFANHMAYYEPTTEAIVELPAVPAEVPPIDPNASTVPYSASFDTAGMLYFATQESQNRPSYVFSIDPVTLTYTALGYVGSGALSYTTYGKAIAPDTGTADKYIYVAYGENPWQLWALNITTGVATKLYEVPATGNIQFSNIAGKGWVAKIDTILNKTGNVHTEWWCLGGALYAYTVGVDPPGGLARNVTPLTNPLTTPPQVDYSSGSGVVRWRPNGSTGAYTTVEYTVSNADPVAIESLVASNDGVFGNAQNYQGGIQHRLSTGTTVWYDPWSSGVSEPVEVNAGGLIYICGYPNGSLYRFDPDAAWDLGSTPPATAINPVSLGALGLNGNQLAGIKYAACTAWSQTHDRAYVAGLRERNGNGMGLGYYDNQAHSLHGVYSAADGGGGPTIMGSLFPTGLVVDDTLDLVICTTLTTTGTGTASILVFNPDLTSCSIYTPVLGQANLGQIFPTISPGVVCGVARGAGAIVLYQFDALTGVMLAYTEIPSAEDLGPWNSAYSRLMLTRRPNGTVWGTLGDALVKIDVNNLIVSTVQDVSEAAPITHLSFASDGATLFMAGGSPLSSSGKGVDGAELYSLVIAPDGGDMSIDVPRSSLTQQELMELGHFQRSLGNALDAALGDVSFLDDKNLTNAESTAISAGQPVYISSSGSVSLAKADSLTTSYLVGVVASDTIEPGAIGRVRTTDYVEATTDQWDAVCGTVGGLTPNTTYYLSDTTKGHLTSIPPSTQTHTLVVALVAITTTAARLVLARPILL